MVSSTEGGSTVEDAVQEAQNAVAEAMADAMHAVEEAAAGRRSEQEDNSGRD